MSNQHTVNHNAALTFHGALEENRAHETFMERRNLAFDNAVIVPIPWKQIHRANVPHLVRHSK